ncbi:MAG: AAA family ATPase [Nanoarchaeota archaeon]
MTNHNIVPNISKLNQPLIIAVTGTPGAGKTVLARKLSLLLKATYIDLNKIALIGGLKHGFDASRQAAIINEKGLFKALKPLLMPKRMYLADSHLSHYLSSSKVSLCIVARCDLKTLQSRLKKRGYGPKKIEENLEAEAIGVCLGEAKEFGHNVVEVDCSKSLSSAKLTQLLKQVRT